MLLLWGEGGSRRPTMMTVRRRLRIAIACGGGGELFPFPVGRVGRLWWCTWSCRGRRRRRRRRDVRNFGRRAPQCSLRCFPSVARYHRQILRLFPGVPSSPLSQCSSFLPLLVLFGTSPLLLLLLLARPQLAQSVVQPLDSSPRNDTRRRTTPSSPPFNLPHLLLPHTHTQLNLLRLPRIGEIQANRRGSVGIVEGRGRSWRSERSGKGALHG